MGRFLDRHHGSGLCSLVEQKQNQPKAKGKCFLSSSHEQMCRQGPSWQCQSSQTLRFGKNILEICCASDRPVYPRLKMAIHENAECQGQRKAGQMNGWFTTSPRAIWLLENWRRHSEMKSLLRFNNKTWSRRTKVCRGKLWCSWVRQCIYIPDNVVVTCPLSLPHSLFSFFLPFFFPFFLSSFLPFFLFLSLSASLPSSLPFCLSFLQLPILISKSFNSKST